MKLIIAVIHRDDSASVRDALSLQGYYYTVLSTTGGFLRAGNDTLLLGLEDEKVPDALALFRHYCSTRKQLVDASHAPFISSLSHAPVEVTVGGATVFVLDTEQFHKI